MLRDDAIKEGLIEPTEDEAKRMGINAGADTITPEPTINEPLTVEGVNPVPAPTEVIPTVEQPQRRKPGRKPKVVA